MMMVEELARLPLLRVRGLDMCGVYPSEAADYYCTHDAPHRLLRADELGRGGLGWWMSASRDAHERIIRGEAAEVDVDGEPALVVVVDLDVPAYCSLLHEILCAGRMSIQGGDGGAAAEVPYDAYSLALISAGLYRMVRVMCVRKGGVPCDVVAEMGIAETMGMEALRLQPGMRAAYVLNCPDAFIDDMGEDNHIGGGGSYLPRVGGLRGFRLLPTRMSPGSDPCDHFVTCEMPGAYDPAMPVLIFEQYLHWLCTLHACFGTPYVPDAVFTALYEAFYMRLETFGPREVMRRMRRAGWTLAPHDPSAAWDRTRADAMANAGGRLAWYRDGDEPIVVTYGADDGAVRARLDAALRAMHVGRGLSEDDVRAVREELWKAEVDLGADNNAAVLALADRRGGGSSRRRGGGARTAVSPAQASEYEALEAAAMRQQAAQMPYEPPSGFRAVQRCMAGRLPFVVRRFAPTMETTAVSPWILDVRQCIPRRLFVLQEAAAARLPALDAACREFVERGTNDLWDVTTVAEAGAAAAKFADDFVQRFDVVGGGDAWPLRNLFLATYAHVHGLYNADDPASMLHLQLYDYEEWSPVLSQGMQACICMTRVPTRDGGGMIEAADAVRHSLLTKEKPLFVLRAQRDTLLRTTAGDDVVPRRITRGQEDAMLHKDLVDLNRQTQTRVLRARKIVIPEHEEASSRENRHAVLQACIRMDCPTLRLAPSPAMMRDADHEDLLSAADVFPMREMYVGLLEPYDVSADGTPAAGADLCAAALEHWLRLGWPIPTEDPMDFMLPFFLHTVFRMPPAMVYYVAGVVLSNTQGLSQGALWMLLLGLTHMDSWDKFNAEHLRTHTATAIQDLRGIYGPGKPLPRDSGIPPTTFRDTSAAGRLHRWVPWSKAAWRARMAHSAKDQAKIGMEIELRDPDDDDSDEGSDDDVPYDESSSDDDDDDALDGVDNADGEDDEQDDDDD